MTSHGGNVIAATTMSGESVSGGPAAKMEPQVHSGHEALYGSWHPMMTSASGSALCNPYPDHEGCQVDSGGENRVPGYNVMKEKYKTNCDPQARTTTTHEAHQNHQHHLYAAAHQVSPAAAFEGPFSRAVPTKLDVRGDPGNAAKSEQSQMAAASFPVTNENYSQHHLPQQSTSDAAAYLGTNGEAAVGAAAAESSAAAAAAAAAAFAAAQHQMQQFDVMQNCYAAASMQYQQQQQGQHQQGKGIYSWMKPYGTGKNRIGSLEREFYIDVSQIDLAKNSAGTSPAF